MEAEFSFVAVPQTGEIILTENPQVQGALWRKM
jgi:hypothetical protein